MRHSYQALRLSVGGFQKMHVLSNNVGNIVVVRMKEIGPSPITSLTL
jgi:hypothetical protein